MKITNSSAIASWKEVSRRQTFSSESSSANNSTSTSSHDDGVQVESGTKHIIDWVIAVVVACLLLAILVWRAFIIKRNGGHFLSPRQTSRPRRRTRGETQCHQRIIEHSSSNPLMIQRSPSNTPFEIPQEDSSRRFPLTARGETFRYQELLLHPSSSEPRSRGAELLDNEIYRRHLRREERRRLRASLRECRGREIDDEGRRQGNGEEDDGLVGNSQTNLMIPISGDSRNTQKNELPAYSIDFGLPKYPIIASTSQSRSSRRINGTNDSIIHSGLGNEHQIELVNEDSNGVEEGEEIGNSNTTSEQGASGMIQSPPPPPSYGS